MSLTRIVTRAHDRKEFRDTYEISSALLSTSPSVPLYLSFAHSRADDDGGINLLSSDPPLIQFLPVYRSVVQFAYANGVI